MTMYRMRQRGLILGAGRRPRCELRRALSSSPGGTATTVFAAHTHTQRAQPTTIAHYLLAVIEQLERDVVRLHAAFATTNRCPLGACAITGTGFPDRSRSTGDAARLRRARPATPTAASRRSTTCSKALSAAGVLLVGLGRFVQDLLQWATAEFGYLRLGDGFVQCSSIMPQKRNPVALEHARAIASKALGQTQAIVHGVHNTPFGDIVDTEDDLQPLVFTTFDDAVRAVRLVAAAMRTAEFDAAEPGRARRGRMDDAHRAGRYAGSRSLVAVCRGAHDRGSPRRRA